MRRCLVWLLLALLLSLPFPASAQNLLGHPTIELGGPQPWACSLDGIGTTLTECRAAPGTGKRLYLTDVVAQSTTATAGLFLIRTGTGTNCATGMASLLPSAATAVRLAHPANTAAPLLIRLSTPLAAPVNSAICVLGVVTNTVTIQLSGYIAP